jgi:hypothetical protein
MNAAEKRIDEMRRRHEEEERKSRRTWILTRMKDYFLVSVSDRRDGIVRVSSMTNEHPTTGKVGFLRLRFLEGREKMKWQDAEDELQQLLKEGVQPTFADILEAATDEELEAEITKRRKDKEER